MFIAILLTAQAIMMIIDVFPYFRTEDLLFNAEIINWRGLIYEDLYGILFIFITHAK